MYHIKKNGENFLIECEEHGERYPGWRCFDDIPKKLQGPLAIVMAATFSDECGKCDGVGEKLSPFEFVIY